MKYFTEEQLAEEIKPLWERAREALNEGQLEVLNYLLNQMAVGHAGLCTLGIQWVGRMLGEIRNEMGETVLDEMLKEASDYLMAPFAREFVDGDEKSVISELILIFRSQHPAVVVPRSETEEEILISLSPCGTGGRIELEGLPRQLPEFFSPCSDGTPVYCKVCKALQKAFNDACGATVWTTEINETLPGGCEMSFFKQKTRGRRLFDSLEFYQKTKPRCRRAVERLQAGNPDIRELIEEQHLEWLPWHDLMIQFAVCIQSAVYRKEGADYLDRFLKKTYDTAFSMFYPVYEAMDDVSMFRFFAQLWHYHIATFRVEEEEERFKFVLDPCGSGGRMYRSDMNKGQFRYNDGLPCLMDEQAGINFNRKDFPIYCTHCASSNRDQFAGNPLCFVVDGHSMKDTASPCVQYLYKKGAGRKVPPELLAQVKEDDRD